MAANIYDLSATAGSNTTIDGVDVSGATGKVKDGDNVMRSLGAYMAQLVDDIGGVATTAGTANAQTVTLASGFTAYAAGQIFRVKIGSGLTNTSSTVTVNVNSIGTKTVKVHRGSGLVDPAVGDIAEGNYCLFLYDGTYLVLLNPSQLVVESTDAGATAGPVLQLYRNSASPAASDIIGQVLFNGEDSAGNTQEYASTQAVITDPTSGSEDSSLDDYVMLAGTRTLALSLLANGVSGGAVAAAADQEAGTSSKIVTSALQHRHPSAAKAWVHFNPAAGIAASYNITSITDNGTGYWTVNIATDFSSAFYAGLAFGGQKSGGGVQLVYNTNSVAAGTFNIFSSEANTAATGADPGNPDVIYFAAFGDQ